MDPNTNKYTFDFWPVAIKMMSDINFLKNILEFDRDTIDEKKVQKLKKFLDDPKFEVGHLKGISEVAMNLASWVIAMDKFYHVNKIVIPKQAKLKVSNAKKAEQEAKLAIK